MNTLFKLCNITLTGYGVWIIVCALIPLLWPVLIFTLIVGSAAHHVNNYKRPSVIPPPVEPPHLRVRVGR